MNLPYHDCREGGAWAAGRWRGFGQMKGLLRVDAGRQERVTVRQSVLAREGRAQVRLGLGEVTRFGIAREDRLQLGHRFLRFAEREEDHGLELKEVDRALLAPAARPIALRGRLLVDGLKAPVESSQAGLGVRRIELVKAH